LFISRFFIFKHLHPRVTDISLYSLFPSFPMFHFSVLIFYYKVWWKLSGAFCRVGFQRPECEARLLGGRIRATEISILFWA